MKTTQTHLARKRPVNLTLNESLVSQAKGITANLSGLVDQLLAEYIVKQNSVHHEKVRNADKTAQAWNAFNEKFGSFADEHSTL